MFGWLGPLELVIILVIVLVIMGPQRLAGAGKALGRAIREFRTSTKGTTPSSPTRVVGDGLGGASSVVEILAQGESIAPGDRERQPA